MKRFLQSCKNRAPALLVPCSAPLQSALLLVLRLYWGYEFFVTGKGKLAHIGKVADFFASLHIPLPTLNAYLAGCTECFCGLLLFVGLGSRLAAIPLTFMMIVAYATADRDALVGIFKNPDGFTSATEFLFMLTAVIVLAFGPGKISIDALIQRWLLNRNAARKPSDD